MVAGAGAVRQSFREVAMGVNLAHVLRGCVRAETGYLGGFVKMRKDHQTTEWLLIIFAAGLSEA